MNGCLKVLLCFPGINIKLASLCWLYCAGWSRQLSGCFRIWMTARDSLMDVDIIASISFCHLHCTDTGLPVSQLMNCHSFHHSILCCATPLSQRFRMQLLNSVETPWKCKVKPHWSLWVKLFLIATQSSVLVIKENSHSDIHRQRYFGGQMNISALLVHQSNRD